MNNLFLKIALLFILQTGVYIRAQINFYQIPFEDLIEKAEQENKPIFLFLSNNNNESWWMENNVFNKPVIGEFYNKNFVCGIFFGQINYSNLTTEKLKIKEYPFILFFDPVTKTGYSVTGGKTEEQLYSYGKTVTNEFKLANILNHRINNINPDEKKAVYKISDNDGRYTLGVRGRRLMYGYPYPNSTSHFVLKADKGMASNSPRFLIQRDLQITDYLAKKSFFAKIFQIFKRKKKKKKIRLKSYKNVCYLNDTLLVRFDESNSMHSEITYRFNGLLITQKLSPLNQNLEASKPNDSTRYYQVDYIIKNDSTKTIDAGVLVLFDMMIDDNDAAQMDAFKTDLIGKVSSEQRRLRGKYAKYNKADHLQRILVYRNKKRTGDLTGDFRLLTDPDEIHIGSWPVFFSVLWDVPEIKVGKRYFDSAVILKWKTKPLKPGEQFSYSTIFGLYNKGVLELVPTGTNFTGTKKDGKRLRQLNPELTVSPDTIFEGQSAQLNWKTENPLNAAIYISSKPKTKQRNRGKTTVNPKKSTTYYLQMLDNGKEIANVKTNLVVLKRPEKVSFDGRFTIGSENKAVTFGYPFPYSTSYFQLYHNKKYYSNNNGITKAKYLKGKQYADIETDKKNELSYESDGFEIKQSLIPLNEKLVKTEMDSAMFFRCEYTIKNLGKYKAGFSLKQFLDLSAIVADSLILKTNGRLSGFNTTYAGSKVFKQLNISDKAGEVGLKLLVWVSGSEKPKSVSIGDWHFLKNLKIKAKYTDSIFNKNPAVLIRWKKNILANESAKFAFIIGANKNQNLNYLYNQAEQVKLFTINFKTNKYKVGKDKITDIIDFIKENEFDFIVLNGFTDNRGTLETNYKLAGKRIDYVKNVIAKQAGISKDKILKKVHGEFFSNQKTNNEEIDDEAERKVNILLFKLKPSIDDSKLVPEKNGDLQN
ncbi:MAG: hypothetical protein B6I20_10615 [Bacteroidetes bacterium 4572_117]|nr:MAG: hypothetical protein B6I20_10615 [Bacteroidetes bacterium 4572_117]